MLAPLHLRLANVRRFLDARIIKGYAEFKNSRDHVKLVAMVKKQKLPINIRFDGHSYDIILMEKNTPNARISDFYVLECGFKDVVKAIATVQEMGTPDELISFSNA